jgi:GNAT superfamily N-acetyltransferase
MSYPIYQLESYEYHRYCKHLLSLDKESRYLRFGYHITDDAIRQLCDTFQAELHRHRVFVVENDDLEVVAVGHIGLEYRSVELAFSVLKDYQKQGMGSSLMLRVLEWCQNRGIKAGCMSCLKHNEVMKKLAKRHGILVAEGPETMADVVIPAVTPASVMHEVAVDGIAKFDHLGKLQRRFARMAAFPLQFFK